MKYVRVYRTWVTTPPAMLAPAAALGTWVRALSYAAELETGGVIAGCRKWPARAWSVVGVTGAEIAGAVRAGLASWEGDDLRLGGYDGDAEDRYRARREVAAAGGRARAVKHALEHTPDRPAEHAAGRSVNRSDLIRSDLIGGGQGPRAPAREGAPAATPASPQHPEAEAVLMTWAEIFLRTRGTPYREGRFDRKRLREQPLSPEHVRLLPAAAAAYLSDQREIYIQRGHDLATLLDDFAQHVPRSVQPKGSATPYCGWHQERGSLGKPSREPKPECPECRTIAARRRSREGDPEPTSTLVAAVIGRSP